MREQDPARVLVLVGSPRRAGNSAALAAAVVRGAEAAGASVKLRFIDDFVTSFLRDCRTCRLPSGQCAIDDGFRQLLFEDFLPADAIVFSSPVYWYGLSAQTKAFLDRTFCYYAASYPESAQVILGMSKKRLGLVLVSEETYAGATLGIVHQLQELSIRRAAGAFGRCSDAGTRSPACGHFRIGGPGGSMQKR